MCELESCAAAGDKPGAKAISKRGRGGHRLPMIGKTEQSQDGLGAIGSLVTVDERS